MPIYRMKVMQWVRSQREITLDVDAKNLADAYELLGDEPAPPYEAPEWLSYDSLENEEVALATGDELNRAPFVWPV